MVGGLTDGRIDGVPGAPIDGVKDGAREGVGGVVVGDTVRRTRGEDEGARVLRED
jgi:hypothetical protein